MDSDAAMGWRAALALPWREVEKTFWVGKMNRSIIKGKVRDNTRPQYGVGETISARVWDLCNGVEGFWDEQEAITNLHGDWRGWKEMPVNPELDGEEIVDLKGTTEMEYVGLAVMAGKWGIYTAFKVNWKQARYLVLASNKCARHGEQKQEESSKDKGTGKGAKKDGTSRSRATTVGRAGVASPSSTHGPKSPGFGECWGNCISC